MQQQNSHNETKKRKTENKKNEPSLYIDESTWFQINLLER